MLALFHLSLLPGLSAGPAQIANGKIAYVSYGGAVSGEIFSVNPNGTNKTNLTNNPAEDIFPAWSPDGTKIAFTSGRDEFNGEVYVMDADGSNVTRLTNNPGGNFGSAWSPDGTKIVFGSARDGNLELYLMNADGSNQINLTNNPADDQSPTWSPDGSRIAFQTQRNGGMEIYVMNADGSNQVNLTNDPKANDQAPAWSPDGSKIAFHSYRDGFSEIYLMNPDGSNITRLTYTQQGDDYPVWSPDGTRIAFNSGRDLHVMDADGRFRMNLTNNRNPGDPYDTFPTWQRLSSPPPPPPAGLLDPHNIIVSVGNPGAPVNSVREFTPGGSLVQNILLNYNNAAYPALEYLRDIVIDRDGSIAAYNGTFAPFLTRYSPISLTATHKTVDGWNTTNSPGYGGIAAFQQYIYVTDSVAGSGTGALKGIIRYDASTTFTTRFASDTEFADLNMGLDGSLYAIPSTGTTVHVYDPSTMALRRQIQLPPAFTGSDSAVSIAVDQTGRLFICGQNQTVYRLNSTGALETSKSTGFSGLTDIDIDEYGRVIIAQNDLRVLVGDTSLTNDFSSFSIDNSQGSTSIFVSFARSLSINPPARAVNLSTRGQVETGDNVLIGGFIIAGEQGTVAEVAMRGVGPSLTQFGIPDALADPTLTLHPSNGPIYQNDNWQDPPYKTALILNDHGLGLQDPKESAIVLTLNPGAYTVVLAGKNGGTGVGLMEIYDIFPAYKGQLANISTRGFVRAGDNVMIGGFILGGNNNTHVVVRGIGPSLAQFGLNPVLADPTLELHDGNGAQLVSNDNWQDDSVSAASLTALALAPTNAAESAVYASLPPGQFTAILAGKNGGIGIGLVEIYNLQ